LKLVGIDTGGTFTDLVLVDTSTGRYDYYKLLTTDDASQGIIDGLQKLMDESGAASTAVDYLVHGTTLATNAVLERQFAPVGLITTRGFRDVLELARQRRPAYYDLDVDKPIPPARRDRRLEVGERMAHDGSVIEPLNEADVRSAIKTLREVGCQAVAICFLHAYANSAHEQLARDIILSMWPEAYVCLSSDVSPVYREFERFSTTTINAGLMPITDFYLRNLEERLKNIGALKSKSVMQSNGGTASIPIVRRFPVSLFFSGPAGGVVGAAALGRRAGRRNLITFDMGGTSTDVCVIYDGAPAMKSQSDIGGFPIVVRTIDMHTIGAGGGSIAWKDPGGLLKVGPRSAGSNPGPVGYGRGGTEATVTDANIALGRLNPESLLGGRMKIYADKAKRAIERIGVEVGLSATEAAAGILSIVGVSMMSAVRLITVERGFDPRDFTLVTFGGAGSLHAVEVALQMSIPKVLVPLHPGVMSALGLLHADLRGDFSLTRPMPFKIDSIDKFVSVIDELRATGSSWIELEGYQSGDAKFEWIVEMRYAGQNFELSVGCNLESIDKASMDALVADFGARHRATYGYEFKNREVELITVRLAVIVERPPLPAELHRGRAAFPTEHWPTRTVWFAETGMVDTPILQRDRIGPGYSFCGPAIIEQMDTTTVVPPGCQATVDEFENIVIDTARDKKKGGLS